MRIDSVSGLLIKEPIFGILTVGRNATWLGRGIRYEPKLSLAFYHFGRSFWFSGNSPWFGFELHFPPLKGDITLRFGRTTHHLFHDLKARRFSGFLKHIKEN